jgi:hypothetical protein
MFSYITDRKDKVVVISFNEKSTDWTVERLCGLIGADGNIIKFHPYTTGLWPVTNMNYCDQFGFPPVVAMRVVRSEKTPYGNPYYVVVVGQCETPHYDGAHISISQDAVFLKYNDLIIRYQNINLSSYNSHKWFDTAGVYRINKDKTIKVLYEHNRVDKLNDYPTMKEDLIISLVENDD